VPRGRDYNRAVDPKRDAPIPWSVSLPCVAAVVALAFGWRALSRRPQSEPASAKAVPPASAAAPSPSPAPTPSPVAAPIPAPSSTPAATAAPREAPVAKASWTPLSEFSTDRFDETTMRGAADAVAHMRDRVGSVAARYFVRAEPTSRMFVVTSERGCSDRGEKLVRFLAPFGERLEALVLNPAKFAASTRPWVAVHVSQDDPLQLDVEYFGGFSVNVADESFDLRVIGRMAAVQQMRRMLAHGPESQPLEWLLVGVVGAAASDSLADAVRFRDPAAVFGSSGFGAPDPSLSQLMAWRTLDSGLDGIELDRGPALATSFVAFCLERGPKDRCAVGLFELLHLDGRSLPVDAAARDAEIASRLGATRLDELDAAWRAARR
jgi:hypothetical protein